MISDFIYDHKKLFPQLTFLSQLLEKQHEFYHILTKYLTYLCSYTDILP